MINYFSLAGLCGVFHYRHRATGLGSWRVIPAGQLILAGEQDRSDASLVLNLAYFQPFRIAVAPLSFRYVAGGPATI